MAETVESMELVGGDIALDLVNTGSSRRIGPFRERLGSFDDLVSWAERVGLLARQRADRLRAEADRHPDTAQRALERIRALREAVYRVFRAGIEGQGAADEDVAVLTEAAAEGASHRRLVSGPQGYVFEWPESDRLDQILWPVAMSAAELLVSEDRLRVKECATENCNWLFVDMSRNRSRRWCDMKDCGNRAKARRHYHRSRSI
jgi:predicted RNA-binding Zn ribbon-like protein